MSDMSGVNEVSLAQKFRQALELFTEQFSSLQNAVVSYRAEHQADMRQIRDELLQLRGFVQQGHTSTDAFTSYRDASQTMLVALQQQNIKYHESMIGMFERMNLLPSLSQLSAVAAAAASAPQHSMAHAFAHPMAPQSVQPTLPPQMAPVYKPATPVQQQPPPPVPSQPNVNAAMFQSPKPQPPSVGATPQAAKPAEPANAPRAPVSFSFVASPKATTNAPTLAAAAPAKPGAFTAPIANVQPPAQKASPAVTASNTQAAATQSPTHFSFGFNNSPALAPPQSTATPKLFGTSPASTTTMAAPTSKAAPALFSAGLGTPASTTSDGSMFGGGGGLFTGGQASLFGNASTSNTSTQGGVSFGSLAANTSPAGSFLDKGGSNAIKFAVDPKQHSLFSGGGVKASSTAPFKPAGADDEDEGGVRDDTAPEDFVPDDSQFKRPDVALPSLVEQTTGEEEEEILFQGRARVYRFFAETKEVKERGTGEIKLLKHPQTSRSRVLMRRDQTLKLCANFSIPTDFAPTVSKGKDNTLVWTCTDWSDRAEHPNGETMTMLCRFKDKDAAAEFMRTVKQS